MYRRGMGPSAGDLRTIPLFNGFTDAELAALAALFTRVPYDETRSLFEVGEQAIDLYLLTAGEIILERPGDDVFRLAPPALIGELGALTSLPRSTRATVSADATVWALSSKEVQAHLRANQELGLRFLVNLLGVVADKVHRDQVRIADMRQNLIRTQKALKGLRELVLETEETPLSAPVHDTLDQMIAYNRRVNYRVEPPASLGAKFRIDTGEAQVVDISRTHITVRVPRDASAPPEAAWLSGVLVLPATELPLSGRIVHVADDRLTLELDLLIDEYAAMLEGYLTRLQLLDVLV